MIAHKFALGCLLLAGAIPAAAASEAAPSPALALPQGLQTYADGRMPIEELYAACLALLGRGWQLEVIFESRPAVREYALPVIALRTPQEGPAVWILSGIHGEETAGPNAIAASIDTIAALGERRPVVLLPLLNPHGYANNWRYLNLAEYSAEIDGHSVGDSSHLLPDPERPGEARAASASSPEADAITAWVLQMAARYPPGYSIDLHEDNLIDEGYVYSQGVLGAQDPLAARAVAVLREHGIPLKWDGETRFGEPVEQGLIGPVTDSSIDELMSASTVIVGGTERPGPRARTVLVFETPAAEMELARRAAAHAALLRGLAAELGGANGSP